MIGWILILATAAFYELWAELAHGTTLTVAVRALSAPARGVILVVGLVLLVHLVIPQSWATRHDPIDNLEHRIHDLSHDMKGTP